MNKRRRLLTLLINGVLLSSLWVVASAADTTTGGGSGVAYGTGSSAPKAENVAVGKGAAIQYSNGASAATGDIAVGSGAVINNYASQGGSVAIGKNAKIENMPQLPYAVEEAINRLRVNVSFLGNEVKKIMVISSEPDEGKSFVAMQLWRQMAEAGSNRYCDGALY